MERQSGFTMQQKLLAAAFFIGPLLLLFSVGAFTLGIGLIPPGITSYIEGMFGAYALMLFIPIYLELAGRLSRTHKILGAVTTVTGLFGAAVGASLELMRVIEYALRQHGAGDTVWQSFYAAPNWEFLLVALLGPLFPLTSILLGVGFFRAKTFPAWVAAALICAGIFFPLAQVLEWDLGLKLFYPLAAVLWLAALSFVGREYTRSLA
ncbi:hypothetical protein HUU05_07035 [candidate division KSB1 bacterium]|nr:hypothetical protein [candidate division KSB1 bacterium]